MSLDGRIDNAGERRLLLSNEEDFARVDALRAGCGAILVGGGTVRADDPRLVVRPTADVSPTKVALSAGGDLDPNARFFRFGDADKLVYVSSRAVSAAARRLRGLATVVDAGEPIGLPTVLRDLAGRGIGRLLVEGGTGVFTRFLAGGLADELHVVIAPFFVGDEKAPRFVNSGSFPDVRLRLAETRAMGDVVLLRYLRRF
jgi:5-amino-6-(5-phosphoribosylamino)uracil reductase